MKISKYIIIAIFFLIFQIDVIYAQQYPPDEMLAMAVFDNNIQSAKDAIRKGANVNARNQSGETIIFTALTASFFQLDKFNADMIRLLIDNGADVNVTDKQGQSPLFIACSQGLIPDEKRAELVSLLLSKGARTNIRANVNMFSEGTPLMYAAMNGYVKTVSLLIDKGADPLAKDEYGNNALYWTIKGDPSTVQNSDKISIIKLLLSKGVDPYNKNDNDETAVTLAEESGSRILTDALKGKKVTAKTEAKQAISKSNLEDVNSYLSADGRLMLAIKAGDISGVKKAVESGAELTLRDENDNTPLLVAANFAIDLMSGSKSGTAGSFKNRLEIVKYLVEKGADINAVNHRDENALYVAVTSLVSISGGRNLDRTAKEIIRFLVSKGADVDIESVTTPLMEACSAASSEIVDILLPNVKNINKVSNDLTKTTALAFAIGTEALIATDIKAFENWMKKSGSKIEGRKDLPANYKPQFDPERAKIVKSLISHGADVNLPSGGIKPLKQARTAGYDEIIKILKNAGAKE